MGFDGEVWRVLRGTELVGDIVIDDADFPWLSGRFEPGPAYDGVRELFARELALVSVEGDLDVEAWEAAYDEILRLVSLESPRGPVPAFLLHIEGDAAWFRWSDEPDEDP
ncbi:hypothetical protein ABZZ79_10990 [Streptomyces sp. NPDC006458]|uniref:hypothetical protein n=1 Tax=Streptomyces sp. NPDC006458 TaxID=3154302 RepID=UPI0033AA2E01